MDGSGDVLYHPGVERHHEHGKWWRFASKIATPIPAANIIHKNPSIKVSGKSEVRKITGGQPIR